MQGEKHGKDGTGSERGVLGGNDTTSPMGMEIPTSGSASKSRALKVGTRMVQSFLYRARIFSNASCSSFVSFCWRLCSSGEFLLALSVSSLPSSSVAESCSLSLLYPANESKSVSKFTLMGSDVLRSCLLAMVSI